MRWSVLEGDISSLSSRTEVWIILTIQTDTEAISLQTGTEAVSLLILRRFCF